jgi:hypothetical protein
MSSALTSGGCGRRAAATRWLRPRARLPRSRAQRGTQELSLDFYGCIRLINFVRKQASARRSCALAAAAA